MKKAVTYGYVFTPGISGVGTLNLSAIPSFDIKKLYAVINATSGGIVYAVGQAGYGYTSLATSTLTLEVDSSLMSGSDSLSIIYDDVEARISNTIPDQDDYYQAVRQLPSDKFRVTFAKAISSPGIDTDFFTLLSTGSGQAISQTGGNLVLTTGTTANSETFVRSIMSWSEAINLKYQTILSQRIANQNFIIELADTFGQGLAMTINSATSITVTIPNNPFTSQSVGQTLGISLFTGTAGTIPGNYAIASVSGNNITFTVAGFPASGSGTCAVYGWNLARLTYNGTTATSAIFETRRRGYNSLGSTTATTLTSASPGHMVLVNLEDGVTFLADRLVVSSTGFDWNRRADRITDFPDHEASLYLQIRSVNGSTAPASTTTWTIGMCEVENFTPNGVSIRSIKPMYQQSIPVQMTSSVTIGTLPSTPGGSNTIGNINIALTGTAADITSAALTTTTTTAAIIPAFGTAYQVNIPVTAVSGTSPTLDVSIEESSDNGTNWFKVYDFPRITATGFYNSPILRLKGTRIRYVQTVSGTTPSFTRSLNRSHISHAGSQIVQLIDRTISPNTLNSTTPSLLVEGCQDFNIFIRCTAQTTSATITLQFSDDNTNWHTTGSTLTTAVGFAHTKVQNEQWKFARAIVSAAGTGITLGELTLKAVGV